MSNFRKLTKKIIKKTIYNILNVVKFYIADKIIHCEFSIYISFSIKCIMVTLKVLADHVSFILIIAQIKLMRNELRLLLTKVRLVSILSDFSLLAIASRVFRHTVEEDSAFINANSHISQRPSLSPHCLCDGFLCANTQPSLNKQLHTYSNGHLVIIIMSHCKKDNI